MRIDQFVAADEVGFSTLVNISGASRLNAWMFDTIRPYVKGKTLEIGSGIGNISSQFFQHGLPLSASDYSDDYCHYLQRRFASEPLMQEVWKIDLVDTDFEKRHARLLGRFDTVVALNVIEHIEDDRLAIANCYKLLAPGGQLVLLMPAWPALYNEFDKELGHCRRYTRRTMEQLLSTHLQVRKIWYFNMAGIFAWLLFGTILRRKSIMESQMNAYDKLVGIFRLADQITLNRIGLSVLGVGKKS